MCERGSHDQRSHVSVICANSTAMHVRGVCFLFLILPKFLPLVFVYAPFYSACAFSGPNMLCTKAFYDESDYLIKVAMGLGHSLISQLSRLFYCCPVNRAPAVQHKRGLVLGAER